MSPPILDSVALLSLCQFLLLMAIARELRVHDHQLTLLTRANVLLRSPGGLSMGAPLPAFTTITTAGTRVSQREFLGTNGLIAFFAASCAACGPQIPQFVTQADDLIRAHGRVLTVVSGDGSQADEYLAALEGHGLVAVEPRDGPLCRAFQVAGFPALYAFDTEGRIRTMARSVGQLRALSQLV